VTIRMYTCVSVQLVYARVF